MYDDLIINEIRKKDKQNKIEEDRRPQLELPLDNYWDRRNSKQVEDVKNTVITIDLDIEED